jgi:hypothetical protein
MGHISTPGGLSMYLTASDWMTKHLGKVMRLHENK